MLQSLVLGYEAITRDPVHRPKKRNLIAACYRVHGPAFLELVRTRFLETGTAMNLLGYIRTTSPEILAATDAEAIPADSPPLPSPVGDTQPGLTYDDADRPPFGADPKRRYDRRPSNPDARGLFPPEELGVPARRSPTADALDR